jgi:hypothetical protein
LIITSHSSNQHCAKNSKNQSIAFLRANTRGKRNGIAARPIDGATSQNGIANARNRLWYVLLAKLFVTKF